MATRRRTFSAEEVEAMLDDSELFSGAKRRREFDLDEEVDAEL